MKRKASRVLATAGAMAALCLANAGAAIITFEGMLSSPETAWKGTLDHEVFQTGGATFSNLYNEDFGAPYWEGFAYSNKTDTTTAGYTNDLSAYTASGGGGNTYAVAYVGYSTVPAITYDGIVDMAGQGASITNTTYGYLSMLDGYLSAKQFGGETGNDEDWFKLTITGYLDGDAGASVDFYLADFRFADNGQDYIINDWTYVDFSGLGLVDELRFTLSSSDNHPTYGMNTPAYFAIDNLVGAVPEPSSLVFAFASLGFLARRKRQR